MHPLLAQAQPVTETVQKAIDAGTLGIAVMLTVVLIVLGVGFYVFISKVITPLITQLILLIKDQKQMVESAGKAVEHSNETNRLVTVATNEQTGELRLLRKDFSAYQTLQTDTTAQLVERFDTFDTKFAGITQLIERNAGDHTELKDALLQLKDGLKELHDDVRKLIPPPPPPAIVNNVTTVAPPAEKSADAPKDEAA